MKIRTASLALFYVMSPVSVRLEERRWSFCKNRNKQGDERTAIRHGTACKSNIPEWAGEGVGIVGIVYLVYAMPTYKTVRPGDDQNVGI
jgi:hypothetical protein